MTNLWRLRLQYEHSVQRCAQCLRRGTVGEDMKVYLSDEQEPPQVVFRCADQKTCLLRAQEISFQPQ